MGAWGSGSFENDTALDWAASVQSLDDVRYKLTKAFSDTTPELKRQEADILERMRGC